MQKEGQSKFFNSKDGKVNLILLVSVVLVFVLSVVYVEAMTNLFINAPTTNYTFNTTTRNLNITFNATWSYGGVAATTPHENVSNCSLYVIGGQAFPTWTIAKNVSVDSQGDDNLLANYTNNQTTLQVAKAGNISYMNFTVPFDGNYTFAIACLNFTNASVETQPAHFSANVTVFVDTTRPSINITGPSLSGSGGINTTVTGLRDINITINETGYGFNLTRNGSVNISIYLGGTEIRYLSYLNSSGATNLTCNSSSSSGVVFSFNCNSSFSFASNGTYRINVSAGDALGLYNSTAIIFTVDQIPPVVNSFNITNGTGDAGIFLGNSNSSEVPVSGDGTWAQGRQLRFYGNVSDNLTAPLEADIQFYNVTSRSWQTINTTSNTTIGINITPGLGTNTTAMVNLTFTPPVSHGEFEGRNVTFRILVNDTLGNRDNDPKYVSFGNASEGNATNITIMINDTTKPTLTLRIGDVTNPANQSNTSDATPIIYWNVTDSNYLNYIAIQVDSGTSTTCNLLVNYSTTAEAIANTNGSITVKGNEDNPGCTALSNGTHTVRLTTEDTWSNSNLYIHQFYVQSGKPGLIFNGLTRPDSLGLGGGVNKTNLTSKMGLNFTAFGGAVNVQNITYVSSCNSSSTVVFVNDSVIFPFNESTCPTTSANQTLTIIVTDNVGNSNSTVFGFTLDNVAPALIVNSPANNGRFVNVGNVSVSVLDNESRVAEIGFYIDGDDIYRNHSSNGSSGSITEGFGQSFISNSTLNNSIGNITSGTHTIKLTVNDTLGNTRNSSVITFTQAGPLNFVDIALNGTNGSLLQYHNTVPGGNMTLVNLTNASGHPLADTRTVTDQTLNLFMALNGTNKGINITITFNASAANWDLYNFSVTQNDTTYLDNILTNFSSEIEDLILINGSIQKFLASNDTYFGVITYPLNISSESPGGNLGIWYFNDSKDATKRKNVTQCSSGFTPSFTMTDQQTCWNTTTNSSISIFVPHFSAIAVLNDTGAPTVNVTKPIGNQTEGMFIPNITVSFDAISCFSSLNGTQDNITMTLSGNRCIGQTERLKNLETANGYNFSFWVIDAEGNTNRYIWNFNVSDTTAPNNGLITTTVTSSTAATVTITGTNETVNATVNYGSVNTSLSTSATETDFNQTQDVSITSLTASTAYFYNVTVCDYNGNCKTNISTFTFTTSSAAASSSSSSTSSSSGGGGGGAAPASNVQASTGAGWDSLEAGSKGSLTSSSSQIAIVGINFNVVNTLSNPLLNLESLVNNPLTTAAAGQVYQYLQLTHSNVADSDISDIKISFKVPRSWLTTNNVAEGDVALYRYSDGWNQLSTTIVSSDADYVTYEASSPGFSLYAVGNKEAAPEAPAEAAETPAAPVEEPAAEPTGDTGVAEPVPVADAEEASNLTAIISVILIILVIGVAYFMYQKKKKQ